MSDYSDAFDENTAFLSQKRPDIKKHPRNHSLSATRHKWLLVFFSILVILIFPLTRRPSKCDFFSQNWDCKTRVYGPKCEWKLNDAIFKKFNRIYFFGDSVLGQFFQSMLHMAYELPEECKDSQLRLFDWDAPKHSPCRAHFDGVWDHFLSNYNVTFHQNAIIGRCGWPHYACDRFHPIIRNVSKQDLVFFGVGTWTSFDITKFEDYMQHNLFERRNENDAPNVFVIPHGIGYLKEKQFTEIGQNRTTHEKFRQYVLKNYKRLNFTHVLDFTDLVYGADRCAENEASDWAMQDGTHTTFEVIKYKVFYACEYLAEIL